MYIYIYICVCVCVCAYIFAQYLACSPTGRVRPSPPYCFCLLTPNTRLPLRYATARIDNLCEDWSGDYYPISGQDPHRAYMQPFCTTEYHPKPHAHGIYSGPYSLRRRCMAGQGAHRLVAVFVIVLVAVEVTLGRCLIGDVAFGRQKRAGRG
jgi:hypothetical protein